MPPLQQSPLTRVFAGPEQLQFGRRLRGPRGARIPLVVVSLIGAGAAVFSDRLRTQRIRHADVTAGLACFVLSIAIRARPAAGMPRCHAGAVAPPLAPPA